MASQPFDQFNAVPLRGPVILSVPHAGRDYDAFAHDLRVPVRAVQPLEDRHADRLVAQAVAAGTAAIIARTPRLAIDLNRALTDLDPAMVAGAEQSGAPLSRRARGGLGLVPSRLVNVGPLWRGQISSAELNDRLARHYDLYHHAVSRMLGHAAATFGAALLLDIHSMPSLGPGQPDFVIGDRFGRTASDNLAQTIAAVATGHGLRVAFNAPYAGGYIVTRHADRAVHRHALQIEFDRKTYLDAAQREPGGGLARMQRVVHDIVIAATAELAAPHLLAAE